MPVKTIKIKADDGSPVEFIDEIIGQGAMKDVYFSPNKDYVVGFFRKKLDACSLERLENITGVYRERIFNQDGGEYWKALFCWPTKIVHWDGKVGIVCPAYDKHFFFNDGTFKGKEKEGKWFASAKLRNRFLTPDQKGTWLTHVRMCLLIARAVRRLHSAGLAHSDLSYKNVLVDPVSGSACVIDIDGLVVPGKYPPDVVGTQDFIAPEVLETRNLPRGQRALPSIRTDRHALAVLIYMYLLYRHPLRGGKVHDTSDSAKDEELSMGKGALFIEHPTDKSNRPNMKGIPQFELPQADVDKMPYTLCGPYLKELFDRAFITALHSPEKRPTANEWERALVKTVDLIQPCQNPGCGAKWFVFSGSRKPRCPFCGTPYKGILPVLNLYYRPRAGESFRPENHRLMVYDNQNLYMWHVSRSVSANEQTKPDEKRPVADFHFHRGQWILINRRLGSLYDVTEQKDIAIGDFVPLTDGRQILLSKEADGRLIVIQLVNN